MNRYTVNGVLSDLLDGKKVAVVSIGSPLSNQAFKDVLHEADEGGLSFDKILRGNGAQRIEACGGVVHFFSHQQIRNGIIRGFSLDVVVLDYGEYAELRREAEYEVAPALIASGVGEVIR